MAVTTACVLRPQTTADTGKPSVTLQGEVGEVGRYKKGSPLLCPSPSPARHIICNTLIIVMVTISSPPDKVQVPRVSKEYWVSVPVSFLPDSPFLLFSTNPV